MRTIAIALSLAALAAPVGAQEGRLALAGPGELTRCGPVEVSGRFVAFVTPAGTLVLLGGGPFPGGARLGTLEGGTGAITVPGIGTVQLHGTGPVFGLVDPTPVPGGRAACLGFDKERFTWTSDLLTYVHWMLREVLLRLPEASGPALTIEDRLVTLEVSGAGVRPIQVQAVEGGTIGLLLPGTEARLLFMPLVLHAAGDRVVVKVLDPTGVLFDGQEAAELAFVEVGGEAAVPIGTSPPLSLRLVAIAE